VSSVADSAPTRVALVWRVVGLDILETTIPTGFKSIPPLSPIYVTSLQAKTVSVFYGWPTDLSARCVRLRREFKSRGSPAHREFSRKCELE
jgi:hypothetical protein